MLASLVKRCNSKVFTFLKQSVNSTGTNPKRFLEYFLAYGTCFPLNQYLQLYFLLLFLINGDPLESLSVFFCPTLIL